MPIWNKSKTKGCKNDILDLSPTQSLGRSDNSSVCKLSKDENIPDNKQVLSAAIGTLNAIVPVMSCDQKPSNKKRLNLKTRAPFSKTETNEQKMPNAVKATVSSEDVEKIQSLPVNKDNSKQNILNEESLSIKSCPVCKCDFRSLDSDFKNFNSDTEINEHINKCLDNAKTDSKISNPCEYCQLCGKDISKFSTVRRQQHMNRCCDNLEKTQPKPKKVVSSILCPICGKPFKTTKTRQTHMKKCAKDHNVSTHQLVELNRKQNFDDPVTTAALTNNNSSAQNSANVNQDTVGVASNNKRKRKVIHTRKNLDEETQLALALSASMDSDTSDVSGSEANKKRRKKKKENCELPALLLRSDDEMKKVTEARAAAVLCKWAENDDDIQCTPALAPSSLVKKYGKESVSDIEKLEVEEEAAVEYDDEGITEITERCDSPVIEIRDKSQKKKVDKCDCGIELGPHCSLTKQAAKHQQYFTIDIECRLWKMASLRTDVVTNNSFYVPNLLPKSTPRKKKTTKRANSTGNKIQLHQDNTIEKDLSKEEPPPHASSQNDELTASQQNDIEILVELLNYESSDSKSTCDEKEQDERIEKTWFPSSGFCVREDIHEDKNQEDADILLNDLSCMVGNPLLSDIEIVAKDNKKFCAHKFMLSSRSSYLAEILHTSEVSDTSGNKNGVVRLELLDIDLHAVRAVMTYIYTAYFIPVYEHVLNDIKKLVDRWNLNCDADKWQTLRDEAGHDKNNVEDCDNNVGELDVLLKSLWEGEEEIVSGTHDDENMFGDSILDDELGDMEIKIYTQVPVQKISYKRNNTSPVSDVAKSNKSDVVYETDQQSNPKSIVLENEDEAISQTSDHIMCIPETPLKLSPDCSPEKSKMKDSVRESDLTLVQQLTDLLETKTCQSSNPDDVNIETSSPRCHSSNAPKRNGGDSDRPISSPISLYSPSSPVEMISSPERSPLPDDFDMEDESNDLNKAQIVSQEYLNDSLNSPNIMPKAYVAENMNVDSTLNISKEYHFATTDEDEMKEKVQLEGNSEDVDHTKAMDACAQNNKLSDENENDSLLDIFASFSDSMAVQSHVVASKQEMNVDSCLDVEMSFLSSASTPTVSPTYSPLTNKKVGKTTKKTASLQAKNTPSRVQKEKCRRSASTEREIIESPKRQCCSKTDSNDAVFDGSPLQCRSTPNNEVPQCYDDKIITPKCIDSTIRRLSCSPTSETNNRLHDSSLNSNLQNNEVDYLYDDDEFIDTYNDGGFNCDIDDYFTCDIHSATEHDNVSQEDEKRETLSSTITERVESCASDKTRNENLHLMGKREDQFLIEKNSIQPTKSKVDNKIDDKDIKNGKNNKTKGKTKRPEKEVLVKQTKLKEFKLRDPRTPILDYSNMATPELKVELKQYGVRPLPKRKMVVKLKEIYNYTHKADSESEGDDDEDEIKSSNEKEESKEDENVQSGSEDTNSQLGSTQDTDSCSGEDDDWFEEENSDDDALLSQQSSSCLSQTLMSFLTQDHDIYFKILKYKPITIADVLQTINANGIKCSVEQLKNFFDEQCITYSEPRPARKQRKGRVRARGKGKPAKA